MTGVRPRKRCLLRWLHGWKTHTSVKWYDSRVLSIKEAHTGSVAFSFTQENWREVAQRPGGIAL